LKEPKEIKVTQVVLKRCYLVETFPYRSDNPQTTANVLQHQKCPLYAALSIHDKSHTGIAKAENML